MKILITDQIHMKLIMIIGLIFAGPSGGVACHGAAAARIFAIYENFSGKSVSVLLVYNSLFFHQSHP